MAVNFSATVFEQLSGKDFTAYNFIDIFLDGPPPSVPPSYFSDIHLSDYLEVIEHPVDGYIYEPELIKSLDPPAKTGTITQEIQRILISQPLGREDDSAEFINRLGNKYYAARMNIRTYLEINNQIYFDEPVNASEGMLKSVSRNLSSNDVVLEFTNSYGKLDMVRALQTTEGSIKRFKADDTSFDKASTSISQRVLEWGGTKFNTKDR